MPVDAEVHREVEKQHIAPSKKSLCAPACSKGIFMLFLGVCNFEKTELA